MPGQVAPAEPASPARPAASASSVLEHAAILGAATGMRSTVALAALIFRRSDGLPAVLKHPAARWIAATADGGGAGRRQAPRDAITPRPAGTYRPADIRQPDRRGSRAF